MRRIITALAVFCLFWGRETDTRAAGTAPAKARGILVSAATPSWGRAFKSFGLWIQTPAGLKAAKRFPYLNQLARIHLVPESSRLILAGALSERLSQEWEASLSNMDGQSESQQEKALSALGQALSEVVPELELRAHKALRELDEEEIPDARQMRRLWEELRSLSLLSSDLLENYRAVRHFAWEMRLYTLALAQQQELGRALREPAAPTVFSKHWGPGQIPDRSYADLLDRAVAIMQNLPLPPKGSPAHQAELRARKEQESFLRKARRINPKIPKTLDAHMMRVGLIAGLVARQMGLPAPSIRDIRRGGRAHDIGKFREPIRAITEQPGKLTDPQRNIMQWHPEWGADMVDKSTRLSAASRRMLYLAALSHHENRDGTGYPRGLAGVRIPLPGRIIHLIDSFDASAATRSYKEGMPLTEALRALAKNGQHLALFDRRVWKAFLAVLEAILGERMPSLEAAPQAKAAAA